MTEGDDKQRIVTLGRIAGVYGVRGWVHVVSDTSPRENILTYAPWYLFRKGQWEPCEVESGKRHGKGVVVKLHGYDDRETAAGLVKLAIGVRREQFSDDLGPGEYYWTDLEGLQVFTLDGQDLGHVTHLLETGANDVLVVDGDRERLIPYLPEQVVLDVDLAKGRIQVDWDPDF